MPPTTAEPAVLASVAALQPVPLTSVPYASGAADENPTDISGDTDGAQTRKEATWVNVESPERAESSRTTPAQTMAADALVVTKEAVDSEVVPQETFQMEMAVHADTIVQVRDDGIAAVQGLHAAGGQEQASGHERMRKREDDGDSIGGDVSACLQHNYNDHYDGGIGGEDGNGNKDVPTLDEGEHDASAAAHLDG